MVWLFLVTIYYYLNYNSRYCEPILTKSYFYSLEDFVVSVTVEGAGVWDTGGLATLVVTGDDAVVVEALVLWIPWGLLIVPNKLPRPICPTPPNNCINCCWDILFNRLWKSPSGFALPLLWEPGVGGLFKTSLIFLQYSSSLSVFRS